MNLTDISCFQCKYFTHLNPDDDFCKKHNRITFLDCTCEEFEKYTKGD